MTLTLASAVVATDSGVKVSYEASRRRGSGNRIVDAAGNEAADFTDQAVRNTSGPLVAVSSGAGTDKTYAIGDTISLTATFPEAVTVTTGTSGAEVVGPRIALTVGTATRHAVYASSSSTTTALVFSVHGGRGRRGQRRDRGGCRTRWRTTAAAPSSLSADGTPATLDTRCGGGEREPAGGRGAPGVRPGVGERGLSSAITFEETLGAAANLANTAFTVKKKPAGGSEQPVSLSGSVSPSISGATVTLTLASAVVATDSGVKVSYGKPTTGSGNRIVDAVGNEAGGLHRRGGEEHERAGGDGLFGGGDGQHVRDRGHDLAHRDVS